MDKNEIIEATVAYVKKSLVNAEGGHDWWHIYRVWNNAKLIAVGEGTLDMQVIELASLLHDIADSKFNEGDEEIGPRTARAFLESIEVDEETVIHVENIVRHISFKGSFEKQLWTSPELLVVQDADRLDAIGAIGIARTFNYGGHFGRAIYDPAIPVDTTLNKEPYKKSIAPTINHFYEKLLLLKNLMSTETGKTIQKNGMCIWKNISNNFMPSGMV